MPVLIEFEAFSINFNVIAETLPKFLWFHSVARSEIQSFNRAWPLIFDYHEKSVKIYSSADFKRFSKSSTDLAEACSSVSFCL